MTNWTPFFKSIKKDPYAHYEAMRKEATIFNAPPNLTYVLEYSKIKAILFNTNDFKSIKPWGNVKMDLSVFHKYSRYFLFYQNGQIHKATKKIVSKHFTLEYLEKEVEILLKEALADIRPKQSFDLINEFAYPFSIAVIAKILGVPKSDVEYLKNWANNIVWTIDVFLGSRQFEILERTTKEMETYFSDLILNKKYITPDSFIARMLISRDISSEEALNEIIGFTIFLIATGVETTTSAIGNAFFTLLKYPQKYFQLKTNPNLFSTAIDELLRYDPPIQFIFRNVTTDTSVENFQLKAGQLLVLCLGAANRDPNKFSSPSDLILNRKPNPHLAFGAGTHYCFGARLARLELEVALKQLIAKFPNLKLAEEQPVLKPYNFLKGYQRLMVINHPST